MQIIICFKLFLDENYINELVIHPNKINPNKCNRKLVNIILPIIDDEINPKVFSN